MNEVGKLGGRLLPERIDSGRSRKLLLDCLLLASLLLLPLAALSRVHVVIDTDHGRLEVIKDGKPELSLENISVGRYGTTRSKSRGDGKTPLGRFRVRQIKKDERFHYFITLDYPDRRRADNALAAGLITQAQHRQIRSALQAREMPPQDTPLGGYIGLHGIGEGNPEIHARFNWTRGCIALTDEQLDLLLGWIAIDTPVEIR